MQQLSAWYANPLAAAEAQSHLLDVRDRLRQAGEVNYLSLRIQEAIARYWLDRDISGDIENLKATCKDDRCRALVLLVYGQLLISRKRQGAMDYLQQGFQQATALFTAAEYLEVMRRHESLKHLVTGERACAGRTLDELLKEAEVIRTLKGRQDYHRDIRADKRDTVG